MVGACRPIGLSSLKFILRFGTGLSRAQGERRTGKTPLLQQNGCAGRTWTAVSKGSSALKLQLDTAHILGNVIAHELGHSLFGPNAHTSWGLMCARWSPEQLLAADRGNLGFSNIERAKIQNSLVTRHQAQGSARAQQAPDTPSSTANNEISSELIGHKSEL